MRKIIPIVEGKGELFAVPKLLQRVLEHLQCYDVISGKPKEGGGRDNLLKYDRLENFIDYAASIDDACGTLILIDADDDCPKTLAAQIADRVRAKWSPIPVAIVIANREYEVWFLASLSTLRGDYAIPDDCTPPDDIETISDVKKWLTKQMPKDKAYKETTHQELMTQNIDVAVALENSRSFKRLVSAVTWLIDPANANNAVVSP